MGNLVEAGGSFVDALADKMARPVVLEVNGEERIALPQASPEGRARWVLADLPMPVTAPSTLVFCGLAGLAAYVKANPDGINREILVAHVKSHARVELIGPLVGEFNQRFTYAAADLGGVSDRGFTFGQWTELEAFIIGLQAGFEPTENLARLLKLVGNIKDESVRQHGDDGVTQTVTAKVGGVTVTEVEVPNPVTLAPFRTFREVSQPESRFVLRMRRGAEGAKPTSALFEADGGAWKLDAVSKVQAYLVQALKGLGVAVIA